MSRPAKRRKTAAVEEIKFNDEARHEYLNGFHKRKLERIKRAQELAAKKAHEEKLAHRRQVSHIYICMKCVIAADHCIA